VHRIDETFKCSQSIVKDKALSTYKAEKLAIGLMC